MPFGQYAGHTFVLLSIPIFGVSLLRGTLILNATHPKLKGFLPTIAKKGCTVDIAVAAGATEMEQLVSRWCRDENAAEVVVACPFAGLSQAAEVRVVAFLPAEANMASSLEGYGR
jgi:hypothetical protein